MGRISLLHLFANLSVHHPRGTQDSWKLDRILEGRRQWFPDAGIARLQGGDVPLWSAGGALLTSGRSPAFLPMVQGLRVGEGGFPIAVKEVGPRRGGV